MSRQSKPEVAKRCSWRTRLAVALSLALAWLGAGATPGWGQSVAGLEFTDWTSAGGTTATGSLLGRSVTLSGWRLSALAPPYLNGTLTEFSAPYFTPPLPQSDGIEFRAEAGVAHTYTLSFGAPTANPMLHLGSLGTRLEFPAATSITRVSGNDGFAVSGSTITGAGDTTVDAYGLNDSNGTVRLNGTFESLSFTATTAYALDGVLLQVGAERPPSATPTPSPPPPDFGLRFADGPATVVVKRGGTVTRRIVIDRNAGSNGQIRLTHEALPDGVHATLSPAVVGGSGATSATLTLTADEYARPVVDAFAQITATPAPGAGGRPRTLPYRLTVQGWLVTWVDAIEVTQAVQTDVQPHDRQSYNGVPLVKGKKTVARAFADFKGVVAAGATRPRFGVALYGIGADGRELPGSPLLPIWSPPMSALELNDGGLTRAERISPRSAFTFVLPDAWTRQRLTLTARALGPASLPPRLGRAPTSATLCVVAACGARPTATVREVPFVDPPRTRVMSLLYVLFVLNGKLTGAPVAAERAFDKLLALSPVPFAFLNSAGRQSPVPVYAGHTITDDGILETTQAWDDERKKPGDFALGVFAWPPGAGYAPGPRVGVADATRGADEGAQRPVTVVAHEVMHLLGLGHADAPAAGCGGGGGGFADPDGRMRSVGIDTTPGSGGSTPGAPPFRIIPDEPPAAPGWDLMSYCGLAVGDPRHWISARNWSRLLGAPPAHGARRLAAARRLAGRPALTLRARVQDGAVRIQAVRPTDAGVVAPGASAYTLVARDAVGQVLSSSPMRETAALALANQAAGGSDQRRVPQGSHRGHPPARVHHRRDHLQLRHQPVDGQAGGVRRGLPGAAPRRPARRHRRGRRGRSEPGRPGPAGQLRGVHRRCPVHGRVPQWARGRRVR